MTTQILHQVILKKVEYEVRALVLFFNTINT